MLGVLAIIGVLSVGAVTGYSKAMMKYKLNKQTEQIGSILDYSLIYADDLARNQNNFNGDSLLTVLKALNVIPVEMIRPNTTILHDIFDNAVRLSFNRESNGQNYFRLFVDITSSDASCLNLLQAAQLRSSFLWQIVFTQTTVDDNSTQFSNRIFGDNYCTPNVTCFKNLSLTQMSTLCETCLETKNCRLGFLWSYVPGSN